MQKDTGYHVKRASTLPVYPLLRDRKPAMDLLKLGDLHMKL